MRSEYIDVAEGRVSHTCDRTAVMQKLPDFVAAFSHHLKPLMRDGCQFTGTLFHPHIDGGIPLDSADESQQIRSHRRSTFWFRDLWFHNGRLPVTRKRLPGMLPNPQKFAPKIVPRKSCARSATGYSYLSATMGSTRMARRVGR